MATEVEVEGISWVTLATEVVLAEALAVGTVLDEDGSRRLLTADALWRAREAALRLLSYRPRTRTELARRLEDKGFPGDVVARCLVRLDQSGLIDDRAFAESFVRDRLASRPKGRRALMHELRSRGVDLETATAVVEEVVTGAGESEVERARRAALRWRRRTGEDAEGARRRLVGFLGRRGFPPGVIRQVVEERIRRAEE